MRNTVYDVCQEDLDFNKVCLRLVPRETQYPFSFEVPVRTLAALFRHTPMAVPWCLQIVANSSVYIAVHGAAEILLLALPPQVCTATSNVLPLCVSTVCALPFWLHTTLPLPV